ncbi:MAG: type I-MYXAN CRISPR-associated endonuclease Cas1 [Nitrososphaerota archaeon]
MALHSLMYCERLFYMEEVEGILMANEDIFAGRRLHDEIEDRERIMGIETYTLSSEKLGLTGKIDAIRYRDGKVTPYEHKRGRPRRIDNTLAAWDSDAIQITAYGMLLEEELGIEIREGKIRYHAENITVNVCFDEAIRQKVIDAIERANFLRNQIERPPITENERLCIKCSHAPICLPEEERIVHDPSWETVRLFPPNYEGKVLHVIEPDAKIIRSGNTIKILKGDEVSSFPINSLQSIVLHGYPQITTQAIHLCASNDVPIHWLTRGGKYVSGLTLSSGQVHRHIRQFKALSDGGFRVYLSKRLVMAKIESQLRYLLRATRGGERPEKINSAIETMRNCLKSIHEARSIDSIRGFEGAAGKAYFEALPLLIKDNVCEELKPSGRSRRPPADRFNALLSFGYSMLYRAVLNSIIAVGLHPSFGFYHMPRTSAHPLVLDIMEIFRLVIWDIALLGSVNRLQWNVASDFIASPSKVWLSDEGKKKAVQLFENRLNEKWRHPVTGYSLSYARTIELEVRLLEKEWMGSPGLFARSRLR